MIVNTNSIVSITEANQNFSKVARLADEKGSVIILKNNVPKYLVVEFGAAEEMQLASDESVDEISKRILAKNKVAYKKLAR